MTLHDIAHALHVLTHKHVSMGKDGIGTFILCSARLPGAGTDVRFRPEFTGAGWYHVPLAYDEEGTMLFIRMTRAQNAWHAMSMLRAEYAERSLNHRGDEP